MIKVIERKKIWFSISIGIMIIGLIFGIINGVNIGIDFKGGTQLVLQLTDDYNKQEVDEITAKYTDDYVTNTVDGSQYQVKSSNLDSEAVGKLVDELKEKYSLEDDIVVSQDEIGASIGNELKEKSLIALSIAFVVMLVYVAIRFEIDFGIAALLALFHDILITISFYTIFDIQINSPFIAAILTIIGYSMNDTIVIFDRIRENVKKFRGKDYSEVANMSIGETLRRSIYTSLTTLFTIVSVCVFVPSVRNFAVPLIVGIVAGAYSSIFIASPIWVLLKTRKSKKSIKSDEKRMIKKKELAKA